MSVGTNLQTSSSSPSQATVFEVSAAIQEILGYAIETQGAQANIEGQSSQGIMKNDMSNAQNIDDEVQQQEHESSWDKIIGDVIDVCMAAFVVVNLACGDVAGAAVGAAMLIAKCTDAFGELSGAIASVIGDIPDISSQTANMVADAITVGIALIAGLVVGGSGMLIENKMGLGKGAEEAIGAVDEGTEMTDFAADATDDAGLNKGEESKETDSGKKKGKSKVKRGVAYTMMGGSQAVGQVASNFAVNFAEKVDPNGKDQQLIEFLVEISAMLLSVGGMVGGACMSISSAEGIVGKLGKGAVQATQASMDIMLGSVGIATGVTKEHMGHTMAATTLDNGANQLNNQMIKNNSTRTSQMINEFGSMLRDTDFVAEGNRAAAYAMA